MVKIIFLKSVFLFILVEAISCGLKKQFPVGHIFPIRDVLYCLTVNHIVITYQFHLSCLVIFMASMIYMAGAAF